MKYEYTKKEASVLQEKQVAKKVNGEVQVASGGTNFGGGDVLTKNWFFECKTVTTEKNSYSVKKQVIDKMKEQCFEQRRQECALVFRFEPEGKDYFVLDENLFLQMFEIYNDYLEKEGM